MPNLQYGDKLNFRSLVQDNSFTMASVECVVPIRFNSLDETWVVCEQNKATHMMIEALDNFGRYKYIFIKIGECENIYLLADAIVD